MVSVSLSVGLGIALPARAKVGVCLQESILHHEQFLETYIELSEPNRNPSSALLLVFATSF